LHVRAKSLVDQSFKPDKMGLGVIRMLDLLKKIFYFGVGVAWLTKEKAEEVVKKLSETGEVRGEEAKKLVSELAKKAEKEKQELKKSIRKEVHRVLADLGLASKEDIQRLEERIKKMEAKVGKS